MYRNPATFVVSDTHFTSGTANTGGGMTLAKASIAMDNVILSACSAAYYGGGVYVMQHSTVEMDRVIMVS